MMVKKGKVKPKAELIELNGGEWCILLESCNLHPIVTGISSNAIWFRIEEAPSDEK